MPFDDENPAKLIRDQKARRYHFREEIVGKLSNDCKEIVHELLNPNPETRIDINQVYEKKWLRKHVEKTERLIWLLIYFKIRNKKFQRLLLNWNPTRDVVATCTCFRVESSEWCYVCTRET